jgi:hypothetical protein
MQKDHSPMRCSKVKPPMRDLYHGSQVDMRYEMISLCAYYAIAVESCSLDALENNAGVGYA